MKHRAGNMGVDLLIVDTGEHPAQCASRPPANPHCSQVTCTMVTTAPNLDMHPGYDPHMLTPALTGTGLSDATFPDGELSNKVFEELDYDLLTIGAFRVSSAASPSSSQELTRAVGRKPRVVPFRR